LAFLVPIQLVAGFFIANYCSLLSIYSIFNYCAVFWIGANSLLNPELVKETAGPDESLALMLVSWLPPDLNAISCSALSIFN